MKEAGLHWGHCWRISYDIIGLTGWGHRALLRYVSNGWLIGCALLQTVWHKQRAHLHRWQLGRHAACGLCLTAATHPHEGPL